MEVPTYSPREIVSELDRFIVGQNDAKRAVAIALRNRWRRQHLPEAMREEVVPKNILRWKRRSSPRSAMSAAMSNASCAIWSMPH